MASGKKHNRFTFKRTYSSEQMSTAEWDRFEDLLARLVAQAYANEHPELFELKPINPSDQGMKDSPGLEVIDNDIQEEKKD
jgi:hypothetical protein